MKKYFLLNLAPLFSLIGQNQNLANITLDVGLDEIKCYLDDELLMVYTVPTHFFNIAGRDEVAGDIIIKSVNNSSEDYATTINLVGVGKINSVEQLITPKAESLISDNSLERDEKYISKISELKRVRKDFNILLSPYSKNILRIRT